MKKLLLTGIYLCFFYFIISAQNQKDSLLNKGADSTSNKLLNSKSNNLAEVAVFGQIKPDDGLFMRMRFSHENKKYVTDAIMQIGGIYGSAGMTLAIGKPIKLGRSLVFTPGLGLSLHQGLSVMMQMIIKGELGPLRWSSHHQLGDGVYHFGSLSAMLSRSVSLGVFGQKMFFKSLSDNHSITRDHETSLIEVGPQIEVNLKKFNFMIGKLFGNSREIRYFNSTPNSAVYSKANKYNIENIFVKIGYSF